MYIARRHSIVPDAVGSASASLARACICAKPPRGRPPEQPAGALNYPRRSVLTRLVIILVSSPLIAGRPIRTVCGGPLSRAQSRAPAHRISIVFELKLFASSERSEFFRGLSAKVAVGQGFRSQPGHESGDQALEMKSQGLFPAGTLRHSSIEPALALFCRAHTRLNRRATSIRP